MKSLLKFLKPYRKLLMIGPSFKLAEAILELMLPFFMSKVIDIGVAKGDQAYVIRTGGIMLLITIVGIIFALICQYSASLVSQGVGTDIRNAMFAHMGTLSNKELDKIGTSSLVNRITNDVNQVQLAIAMLIRLVIRAPFLCIGSLVMAIVIDLPMSVIVLLTLPIFILILFLSMKRTIPLYRKVQQTLDRISLVLRENLRGVRVIRAFSKIQYEKNRFAVPNKEYEENSLHVGRISALLNPLTSLVMNVSIGAILWYGGFRVNSGNVSEGEIIALIGYITQILASLIIISNLVVMFTKAFASAGRIAWILEMESSIEEKGGLASEEPDTEIAVEFRGVSMAYESLKEYDIHDMSFSVKRGETVGIIGGTGSGKSTLVNLIPRFYDAIKGQVLVNGIDVKEYPLKKLRSKIGIVLQKSVLFTGTIEENIRWGRENATRQEVEEAADLAQASEFIHRLPDGFAAKISQGGVNVSGGQRQRLTIARALVKKPEILILDDSFNALDFATDAALRKAIRQCTNQMTTFIVSQRASTIKGADKILVLNEGEIVGAGVHEELLENCEIYHEIYESQMQNKER